jgi:hypothetical protein
MWLGDNGVSLGIDQTRLPPEFVTARVTPTPRGRRHYLPG